MNWHGVAALGLATVLAAQTTKPEAPQPAASTPTATELLARYQKLDAGQRSEVVRNLEKRCQKADNDVLQGIQGRQKGRAAYAMPAGVKWFEPREFAPVAAARSLVPRSTGAHRVRTAGMKPFVLVPELRKAVGYDWMLGSPVQSGSELTDDQRIANYANGFAPGADHALAQVLHTLDADPEQRRLAEYFEHLYADRDGGVYEGVSLYDAWRSGETQEMPDTDAIAFARLCLDTRAYSAPIPENRRRERLYQKMATGYATHHEHRTLRQSLAATFVAAEPTLDPTWQSLVDRGHWLWQKHQRDPAALAQWLAKSGDRTEVLREVDAARKIDDGPGREHRQALASLATWLRQCLDQELTRAGV